MAKSKTAEWTASRIEKEKPAFVENWNEDVPRFYKQCDCKAITRGYRTTHCKLCHKPFPEAESKPTKSKATPKANSSSHDIVNVVQKLVGEFGSMDKAITALQNAQHALELTESIGGISKTMSLMESLRDATK